MAKERQRLNLDLEALFPGDTIKIGDQVLDIRPLNISKIAIVARKLKGFGKVLSEEDVTWDNYNEPQNLLKLATVLLDQFPEVLEEGSDIALEDLQQLPIEIIVQILDKVIEVNVKSKETLMGNWNSLAGKLNLTAPKKSKLQKQFKS